jgi:choice-of-anchor B domain-containing protein
VSAFAAIFAFMAYSMTPWLRALAPGLLAFFGAFPVFGQSATIELVYNWTNPALPSSSVFANTYNECWGFIQDGVEYGVIGSTYGTHIFHLGDPAQIYQVDSVEAAFTGPGVIHRDYHDYAGYLYAVCDEGSGTSTLQIIDLHHLPDSVSVVYDSKELFSLAHNIFIDTANARLYAFLVGFAPGFASMAVYSLEDPTNPVLLREYNEGTQVHDGYVRDNIAYLNDGYNGRVLIMDWTDAENPVVLGSLDSYPDRGYNHSGYLHPNGSTYVFADENHGARMKVCDVSDPTDIDVLATFFSEVDASSIVHNPLFRGDYLFSAHYHDGLYIHDLSDPADPRYVAHYKTYLPDDHISYRGAWGTYPLLPSGLILVSDMQFGFFVFRVNGLNLGQELSPASLSVTGVSPNPFADVLQLSVQAERPLRARAVLLDMQGRLQAEQGFDLQAGASQLRWEPGAALPPGLYVLRLETPDAGFSEQLLKLGQR